MIRKITLDDKQAYLDMSLKFYQSIAVIKPKKPRYLLKTLKEMISDNPYLEGYVYEINGQIAGYMLLTFTYSNEFGGEVINIDELYIRDEFQGMGIGTQLLEFVEETYTDCQAILLMVNEENKFAKKLYSKQGYKEIEYLQMIKQSSDIEN